MLRIERGTGLFRFWRFCAAYSMPCTQGAPLHFTESYDSKPNRKRSHETAHRLHDTVNRGAVQSIRANGRYFANPTSVGFVSDFKPFPHGNFCKSNLLAKCLQFHLKNRLDNIHRKKHAAPWSLSMLLAAASNSKAS